MIQLFSFLAPLILGLTVQANAPLKPVSVSYENILKCFPELVDERLSFKVDLNRLKDRGDEKFVTAHTQLRQRKVQYLNLEGETMNLILRNTFQGPKKIKTELTLQKIDAKGVVTDIALTGNQRINPKQETINNFLLGANIKSDEYFFNDTKLNGLNSTYRRLAGEIEEYDLVDVPKARSISCSKEKSLGIICTCSKK